MHLYRVWEQVFDWTGGEVKTRPLVSAFGVKYQMTLDDDTQSLASSGEQATEPASSRSRRGFLRKAAGTATLGGTGLTAATEAVNALKFRKYVDITGEGPGPAYYSLIAKGDILGGFNVEENDWIGRGRAKGRVLEGGQDTYHLEYGLAAIVHLKGGAFDVTVHRK